MKAATTRLTANGLPVVLRVDPMLGLHGRLAPELLDGVLGDAGLPLFVPQRKAMAGLPGR